MNGYFHSVRLISNRCRGCVSCIKRCPTEAIRIRGGKARITESRCIDCGECIRRCPNHAKTAVTDTLADLTKYKYNIALPAPSLYSQFAPEIPIPVILTAFKKLGFDDVCEVASGAEIVAQAIKQYLERPDIKQPVISSACPAVVRLIQVKFPELIEHILPFDAPVEVAARLARRRCPADIDPDQVGVWFITPCPAKMTAVIQPLGRTKSAVSGAIAINKIYGPLLKVLNDYTKWQAAELADLASWRGIGWAAAGGETASAGIKNVLVVHEIHSVCEVLEQVALGKLSNVTYIESLACAGGCIGGPLTVENRFVSEVRFKQRLAALKQEAAEQDDEVEILDDSILGEQEPWHIAPSSAMRLDEDIFEALSKVEIIQETLRRLPGLDCGSCGSPSCKSLAEDIAQGLASETDCVFKLRERVRDLAQEMVDLAQKLPPSLERE